MTDRTTDGPTSVFAPARVDLSPGFTDVEPFCAELPGRVTNVALDLGVTVTLHDEVVAAPTGSFVDRLRAATARRLDLEPSGVRVAMPSLPSGSGLGASGALSVALAYALSLRAGASVEPADLVALACAAERDVGLTGGTQDQLASVYGGAGLVRRHRDLGHRVPIEARLDVLGEHLVLVHGKGSRNSGSIIERVLHQRPRAAVLRTIEAMNRTGERLADSLRDADYGQLAGWMNESTTLLRELDPDIVGDGIVEWLRGLGARAAKPCGAGGPGAVWAALVQPTSRQAFTARITESGWSVLPAAPNPTGAARVTPTENAQDD